MSTLSSNEASQLLRSFSEISPSTTPTSQVSVANNAPKYGTLIANRIFVGGIPANTNEQELKHFFDPYGSVKDVKIISDRAGVSKGYGFVTFDAQDIAEKLIKTESENLIFKERKLNIGYAIRKQQVVTRNEVPSAVYITANGATASSYGSLPYPMALFHTPGQEITPGTACTYLPNTPYTTMLMQPSVYLPQQHYSYAAPAAPATTVGANTASQWQVTTPSANSNTATAATAAQIAASAAVAGQFQWPQGWPVPPQVSIYAPPYFSVNDHLHATTTTTLDPSAIFNTAAAAQSHFVTSVDEDTFPSAKRRRFDGPHGNSQEYYAASAAAAAAAASQGLYV